MQTPWIESSRLAEVLERHEAFWAGELGEGPLLWVTVPDAKPGAVAQDPGTEEELWTDVDCVMAAPESSLARTHYAGDALPVYRPWLGPDPFAAWLGAAIRVTPRESTSWVTPFVEDWEQHPVLTIDSDNRWWQLYLQYCGVRSRP